MSALSDRMNQTDARHAAWVAEQEDQRTRAMYSKISWMLIETIAVSVFVLSFHK